MNWIHRTECASGPTIIRSLGEISLDVNVFVDSSEVDKMPCPYDDLLWSLCEQAANEPDPDKVVQIAKEINRILAQQKNERG